MTGTFAMFNARPLFRGRSVVFFATCLLVGATVEGQSNFAAPRGPLARLVRTPDDGSGAPPFALADQAGNIQRYVEPVPGIELEPYVNQVVTVRHDTGPTLLASQLELPQLGLYPMVGDGYRRSNPGPRVANASGVSTGYAVRQAEFVDNDDSTVELIEDGQPMLSGPVVSEGAIPPGAIYPDGTPVYPGQMAPGMPMMDPNMMYGPPMQMGSPMVEAYPSDYGMYTGEVASGPGMGFIQPFGQGAQRPHLYAELDINFLRAHVSETTFGKLSEKYEFSPRFVVGFSDVGGLSGRVRYWTYGRGTNSLDEEGVHIEFDVFDFEATHLIEGKRSQVELAAGLRTANIEFKTEDEEFGNVRYGSDLIGLTMAADGWTPIYKCQAGCIGWVYGGRLSILAGDWGGEDGAPLAARTQDDNTVVHELYVGLAATRCCRGVDLNAALAFEMQNWHSDVLSDATGDSIGFVGPGVRIGADF